MYISAVRLIVEDVDRAVDFFTAILGWEKTMDAPYGDGSRWVTVAPRGAQTAFTLDKARFSSDRAGGMSGVIIEVDDVWATHRDLAKKGVGFTEAPRQEPWGGWAMFKDSEGNVHGLHSPVPAGGGRGA